MTSHGTLARPIGSNPTWPVPPARSVASLLAIVIVTMLLRRSFGAFEQPLKPAGLVVLALSIAAVSGWLHRALQAELLPGVAALSWQALCSLLFLMLAVVVSIRGSSAPALLLVWTLGAGIELVWWWRWMQLRIAPVASITDTDDAADHRTVDESTDCFPDDVVQRLTRGRDDEGRETIWGQARAFFDQGQRNASIHLAFCPPLMMTPEVTVDVVDGPPSSAKVALVVPHGARIEVRLECPASTATSVVCEFFAADPAT